MPIKLEKNHSDEFMNQTYSKEEIFDDNKYANVFNSSLFFIEELKGVYLGRCYMICSILKVAKKDFIQIDFWKYRDIKG